MNRKISDFIQEKPVPAKETVQRRHRKIAEVLVVDSIELAMVDQRLDVRRLNHGYPVLFENARDCGDETIDIRYVGQNVIGVNNVGANAMRTQSFGEVAREERAACRHADVLRSASRPLCRVDTEHRDPGLDIVLQQITVVARQLDDEAVSTEMAPLDQLK